MTTQTPPAAPATMGQLITLTTGRTMGMAKGLLGGVEAKDFARQPKGADGRPVDTNHPAFVYGHLALYPARVLGMLGIDAADITCPQQYTDLFAAGVKCVDDPDGTKYPAMSDIVARFESAYARLIEVVRDVDDSAMSAPIVGNDRYREVFGTVGGAASFMMHDHVMFHLGQISAWRRMMGLGSVM